MRALPTNGQMENLQLLLLRWTLIGAATLLRTVAVHVPPKQLMSMTPKSEMIIIGYRKISKQTAITLKSTFTLTHTHTHASQLIHRHWVKKKKYPRMIHIEIIIVYMCVDLPYAHFSTQFLCFSLSNVWFIQNSECDPTTHGCCLSVALCPNACIRTYASRECVCVYARVNEKRKKSRERNKNVRHKELINMEYLKEEKKSSRNTDLHSLAVQKCVQSRRRVR